MRQRKTTFFVTAMLVALIASTTVPAAAQSTRPSKSDCPPGMISVTVDAPPPGMANIATVHLNEDCQTLIQQVRSVSVDRLPAIALDPQMRATHFAPITDTANRSAGQSQRTLRAEQAIFDVIGVLLNRLYSTIYFTYNGSVILSSSAGGGTQAHGEIPPVCGSGWYLTHHLNAHVSGGVGSYSTGFVQAGEFGYRGMFDCSGSIYYNKFSNHTTVYANGSGSCQFTQHYRTWSYLWRWTMACY